MMISQLFKPTIVSLAIISLSACVFSSHPPEQHTESAIYLWENTPMDVAPKGLKEQVLERSKDPTIHDRAWLHVTKPALIRFSAQYPNGCSLIVAPGGAYQRVVFDKEGRDITPLLNQLGYTVFILKYRLPGDGYPNREWVPLQDAQRAVRLVRQHSSEWQLNNQCVGILGFSAGGHLAASLATQYKHHSYPQFDAADKLSARPDFVGLMYPVISMEAAITHPGSRQQLLGKKPRADQIEIHSLDKQVTRHTPPTFIGLANDDSGVDPENSVLFYQALRREHVPAEMHIFQHSGHGFGIRNAQGNAKQWLKLFSAWLNQNHFDQPTSQE